MNREELRQYYAGQAMIGLLSDEKKGGGFGFTNYGIRYIAKQSVELADLLIEALNDPDFPLEIKIHE